MNVIIPLVYIYSSQNVHHVMGPLFSMASTSLQTELVHRYKTETEPRDKVLAEYLANLPLLSLVYWLAVRLSLYKQRRHSVYRVVILAPGKIRAQKKHSKDEPIMKWSNRIIQVLTTTPIDHES